MAILYLNGRRLRQTVLAGAQKVMESQDRLNKINVFPVPDGDTGTNMALTMRFAAEGVMNQPSDNLSLVGKSLKESILMGARGNSGAILAQFFQAISDECQNLTRISLEKLTAAIARAVVKSSEAISDPKPGTILTVMQSWAEFWSENATKFSCLTDLLEASLNAAQKALARTPEQLPVLAKNGVVDAGAKGFVAMLEGIHHFARTGEVTWDDTSPGTETVDQPKDIEQVAINYTYCTEALIRGENLQANLIRNTVQTFGDSLIVAGGGALARVHIHTNEPEEVFQKLRSFGALEKTKAEDMKAQYAQRLSEMKDFPFAILVDSSCDLPSEILVENHIRLIPVQVILGLKTYQDRIDISPEMVYRMMADGSQPKTSQPSPAEFESALEKVAKTHGQALILTVSGKLSGTFQAAIRAGNESPMKVEVFDSCSTAGELGLLVQEAIWARKQGMSLEQTLAHLEQRKGNATIFVSLKTLDHAVKSGRLPKFKAVLADWLGINPLLTIRNGLIEKAGAARKGQANLRKLIKLIQRWVKPNKKYDIIISQAQAQTQAEWVREQIAPLTDLDIPILDVSPTLGVHVGPGTVAVSLIEARS